MRIKYGNYKVKYTREDGVEVDEKETYQNGSLTGKQIRYEIRKKVANDKEELAEWLKFRTEHKDSPILEFKTERKSWLGQDYFIILSWEEHVQYTK